MVYCRFLVMIAMMPVPFQMHRFFQMVDMQVMRLLTCLTKRDIVRSEEIKNKV